MIIGRSQREYYYKLDKPVRNRVFAFWPVKTVSGHYLWLEYVIKEVTYRGIDIAGTPVFDTKYYGK